MTTHAVTHWEAWDEGWRKALADAASGRVTLICGGSQWALDEAAGYRAGRQHAQGRQEDREAGS